MIVREYASWWTETASADNAVASGSRAAPDEGQAHYVTSVAGSYSASTSGELTLSDGATVVGRWYVHDGFVVDFSNPIRITGAVSLDLAASGAGGTVGAVTMSGYTG